MAHMKITEKIFKDGRLIKLTERETDMRIYYQTIEAWENVQPWKNLRWSVQILVDDENALFIE